MSTPAVQTARTATGTAYALLTPQPDGPAPTLLLLAMAAEDTLRTEPYGRVGQLLYEQGWNVVSLDLPCHGADRRADEPPELVGWAARVAAGVDFVADFRRRVNEVIEHLVKTGIADPYRLAAAGTSRGGFMAFHAAAGHPGIRAVAAFAPVTDLRALTEFTGLREHPLVAQLALTQAAEALADRAAWIIIGNADDRVGTERAVAFAQAVTAASRNRVLACDVTLEVVPAPGHCSFPEWHTDAAAWLQDALLSTIHPLPAPGHPRSTPCTVYPPRLAAGARPGLVIHLYGRGGSHRFYNLMRPPYARLRRGLRERGYWLVVPELGQSHWMNEQAVATIDAIIAELVAKYDVDPTRVHVIGTSMGAASGLIYTAQRAHLVRSIAAIFPITDFVAWTATTPDWIENVAQPHGVANADAPALFRRLSPQQHVTVFARTPVFLLHGDADAVVPVSHSREFAAALRAAGCPVTYHEVPGGTHDDGIAASWQDELLRFLVGGNPP